MLSGGTALEEYATRRASAVLAALASRMPRTAHRSHELFHIGARMRRIALQNAVGGMSLSIVGTGLAAAGYLPQVAGAIAQEIIDAAAVLNAIRVAVPTGALSDS